MFRRVLATAPQQASRAIASTVRPTTTTSFVKSAVPAVSNAAIGRRSYHEKVLDHYNNPRNVGSMQKNAQDVGTGLVGAPACGDVMKLQIKVDPNNDTITDVKFKTFGCGSAIASSSYLTELVRGMTLEQAGRIKNTEIAKELCLPPVKRKQASWSSIHIIEYTKLTSSQSIALCSLKTPSNPPLATTTPRTPRLARPTSEAPVPPCPGSRLRNCPLTLRPQQRPRMLLECF